MKFNEKLIELRKKNGLSQEELGYKLNVTRQTISKWELGQTTPEMDKLIELSKIFNISVDELINSKNKDTFSFEPSTNYSKAKQNSSDPVKQSDFYDSKDLPPKKKTLKYVIIGIIAIILIAFTLKLCLLLPIFNKLFHSMDNASNVQDSIWSRAFGIFDTVTNEITNNSDSGEDFINNFTDSASNLLNSDAFNTATPDMSNMMGSFFEH